MLITLTSLLFLLSPAFSHDRGDLALVQQMDIVSPVVLINSAGSTCAGSLVGEAGQVITAYHCVERRRPIVVTNSEGDRFEAELIHSDRKNDLALLSVNGLRGSPYFRLSLEALVGEDVTVVGHPFGSLAVRVPVLDGLLRWSVTGGTVSAVGQSLIQLDSAFNPGTSGGAILNGEGELIGVASRKLRGERLAFAVPSSKVADLLREGSNALISGSLLLDAGVLLPVDISTPSLLIGPVLELRDRLIFETRIGVPQGAKWRTLSMGETSWRTWEAQVFWRFRFSTVNSSFTAEIGGGVAGLASQTGEVTDNGRFMPNTTYEIPISSTSVRLGIGGWRLGVVRGGGGRWGIAIDRNLVDGLLRF